VCSFKVLFFDSNLLHASSGNRSPFPRRNLFVAFNAWSNRLQAPFFSEVRFWSKALLPYASVAFDVMQRCVIGCVAVSRGATS
jgi:hypothetical protein